MPLPFLGSSSPFVSICFMWPLPGLSLCRIWGTAGIVTWPCWAPCLPCFPFIPSCGWPLPVSWYGRVPGFLLSPCLFVSLHAGVGFLVSLLPYVGGHGTPCRSPNLLNFPDSLLCGTHSGPMLRGPLRSAPKLKRLKTPKLKPFGEKRTNREKIDLHVERTRP